MLMYIWVWHQLNTVTIINQTRPGVKIKQKRHNKCQALSQTQIWPKVKLVIINVIIWKISGGNVQQWITPKKSFFIGPKTVRYEDKDYIATIYTYFILGP